MSVAYVCFRPIADISKKLHDDRMSLRRSLLFAAAIGIAVSLVANGCKLAFTHYRPEADEWLAYAVMAAFPFTALAAFGFRGGITWLLAILLTLGAWGAYLVGGIPQLAGEGFIDMGLGFLVATSPIWIATVAAIAGLLMRRPAHGG